MENVLIYICSLVDIWQRTMILLNIFGNTCWILYSPHPLLLGLELWIPGLGEGEQRQESQVLYLEKYFSIIVDYSQETDLRLDLEKFRIWEMFYLHLLGKIYREVKCTDGLFHTWGIWGICIGAYKIIATSVIDI